MKKQIRSIIHQRQEVSGIRILVLFIGLTMLTAANLLGQGIKVTGTVKDGSGAVLEGVSVTVKGTATGTLTDEKGKYTITANDAKTILVFSSIGFSDLQELVGTRKSPKKSGMLLVQLHRSAAPRLPKGNPRICLMHCRVRFLVCKLDNHLVGLVQTIL